MRKILLIPAIIGLFTGIFFLFNMDSNLSAIIDNTSPEPGEYLGLMYNDERGNGLFQIKITDFKNGAQTNKCISYPGETWPYSTITPKRQNPVHVSKTGVSLIGSYFEEFSVKKTNFYFRGCDDSHIELCKDNRLDSPKRPFAGPHFCYVQDSDFPIRLVRRDSEAGKEFLDSIRGPEGTLGHLDIVLHSGIAVCNGISGHVIETRDGRVFEDGLTLTGNVNTDEIEYGGTGGKIIYQLDKEYNTFAFDTSFNQYAGILQVGMYIDGDQWLHSCECLSSDNNHYVYDISGADRLQIWITSDAFMPYAPDIVLYNSRLT